MRKSFFLPSLAVAALFLLTSCSLFSVQSINDLLQVPALGQGQAEVQKALEDYLGEKPQYKFPKSGENSSPLLFVDFNGDGVDEAVLFFSSSVESPQGESRYDEVYMAVLEQQNGEWRVTTEETALTTDVASVISADFFADGTNQLVVGYSNSMLSNKQLVIYGYKNEKLERLAHFEQYDSYAIDIFFTDGQTGIAVVYPTEEGMLAVNFLDGQSGKIAKRQDDIALSANIDSCIGLFPGKGPENERLLVLDGVVSGSVVVSVILKLSESGERFYIPERYTVLMKDTARSSKLLKSMDIDEDGIIDIPVETDEKIETALNNKSLSFIEWKDFISNSDEETGIVKEYGVFDADRGIYVKLPKSWKDKVEMVDGARQSEWTLREKESGKNLVFLKVLSEGAALPEDVWLVPGVRSVYIQASKNVNQYELRQIDVSALN